jgi:hypothetical protein
MLSLNVVEIVYRMSARGFGRAVELWREAGDVRSTSLLPGQDLPRVRIFED